MSRMSETPEGVMETYDWQDVAEDLQETINKALRIIDKYKETYIICFDESQWNFVKRLEKCLKRNGK